MVKKLIGLLILLGWIGTEIISAKMPFLPANKIKVEDWRAELNWSDEVAGKIMLAKSNHANKLKVIKSKQKKASTEFGKLLEQSEPSKNETETFVNNMSELEKSRWENDIAFVSQIKKILKPDQQNALNERMSTKKKKSKAEDSE